MKAVILAAGAGNRLGFKKPKALVTVNRKPLLAYQIELLQSVGIRQIAVVTGFQAGKVADLAQTLFSSVTVFENKDYKEGNILSSKAALPFLDDDFLLMNADHIYPHRLLTTFLKQTKGITTACDFDRLLVEDDMKILLDEKKNLKAIDKQLKHFDGGYIGMTFCPKNKITVYAKAFAKTLAVLGPKTSVEKILDRLAVETEPIHIADASGIGWLEIDTAEELEKAETTLIQNPDFLS